MRVKEYLVLHECVRGGVLMGLRRARKHSDNPSDEAIIKAIESAVLLSISEYFDFDEVCVATADCDPKERGDE